MPLDPQVQRAVDALPTVDWEAGPDPAALRAARRQARHRVSRELDLYEVVDRSVSVPGDPGAVGSSSGPSEVRVRCYRPSARGNLPLVIFFHGGGFVLGDLDTQDALARRMAKHAEAVVVSVDYRLAPEHPYPAATEDAMTVYRWALSDAARELDVDITRIAVCGESSGGNLAAGLCLAARDAGLRPPVFQLLWFPSTDFRDTPSRQENAHAPLLSRAALRWLDAQYLPPDQRAEPPMGAAPGRAADLSELPAAYVLVAQYDPLRDEGVAYADKLRTAGVPVCLELCPTMPHGFLGLIERVTSCAAAAAPSFGALYRALRAGKPAPAGR